MVFITAGMGGGTGTGASHVIANHASTMGILTVAVVSKPFHFEKEKRMRVAEDGIRKLKENVDAIIVIPNQKLLELGDANITYKNAYKKADEVLLQAVRGISDIINSTGAQNVDFADVKATMVGKGITLMGTGEAKGENRAEEATKRALNSPLLDNLSINGATGILYNITASSTLTLAEIEKISDLITRNADADATIKFGVIEDENAGDTLRVTVIATGFKEGRQRSPGARQDADPPPIVPIEPSYRQPTPQAQHFLGQGRPGSSGVDLQQLRQRQQHAQHDPWPGKLRGPAGYADLSAAESDQEKMIVADTLVRRIGQLVNPASDRVARGAQADSLRVERDVCVAGRQGKICFIGPEKDLAAHCRLEPGGVELDAGNGVVLPGLVDPHTHLPFAGTRQDEFQLKLQGVSYQEIAARGGGIKGTVRKTREIGHDELVAVCRQRLDHMLLSGTTTLEAKSGYGLDRETELKQLRSAAGAGRPCIR